MNVSLISGKLVKNPVMRKTETGKNIVTFSVDVARPKDKRVTDYIDCVAWSPIAEKVMQECSEGTQVAVNGILGTHVCNKDGDRKRFLELHVDEITIGETKTSEG